MRSASLFAGIGGFDLGFERAGITTALQVEIDGHARKVLEKHFPTAVRLNDVRRTGRDAISRAGGVDLICGGFPCQDVSVAGHRAGLEGDRSGLWFEFRRILDEARPQWVVIENVPGLLSSNAGRDMGTVLAGLGKLGYGWAFRVLDAQWFGVAQRRRRVFIVGHLGNGARAAEVLFESDCVRGDSAPSTEARQEIAGTLEARTSAGGFPGTDGAIANHVVPALTTKCGNTQDDQQTLQLVPFRKSTRAHHADDWESWELAERANTLDAGANVTATSHAIAYSVTPATGDRSASQVVEVEKAGALTAMEAKKPESGIRILDDTIEGLGVRRLTPVECERLQGFPDNWTAGQSDSQRYRQLGNAVCVNVAHWIGRRIQGRH